jgi:membrane protein required for colicin V production
MNLIRTFNTFDIFLCIVILFSTFLGLFRGFVKETLSLCAWFGSGILAWKYHESAGVLWTKWITSPPLLKILCYGSIFIVSLIITLCIVQWIALAIQGSLVRSVDSSLGALFGAARGVFLVVLGYTASLYFIVHEQQPEVVKSSYSEPWLNCGAVLVDRITPEHIKNTTFIQSVKSIIDRVKEQKLLTEHLLLPQHTNAKPEEKKSF